MLPMPTDAAFPAALKRAREAKGLSYAGLARLAQTHSVMPARYENGVNGGAPVQPTHNTWLALNKALGFTPEPEIVEPALPSSDVVLRQATIEQIAHELHTRNIKPTFEYMMPTT